jgi:serine/threonine protein kinase
MSVSVGDKLGPYEILAPIGKGGMGEVWRARDTRLNRNVAVKFTQSQFSDRFQREANAIASLNHANICTLHDVGPNYLVMELIEGPTLADRVKEGPIPLDESLAIAKQIADALEAAHEKGIVHRDLKPGNIKIRPDGSVKVLDFGLAKCGAAESTVTHDSPTLMQSPTEVGVILGTAAYMAPEQARGKTVDKRADIWSFGVVLYEMLTGKKLFEGEDLTETLASVVKSEPNLTPAPLNVRRLLAKCLEKDPKKRLRDIGDWKELLDSEHVVAVPLESRFERRLWIATAATLALALAVVSFSHFREKPPATPAVSFEIPPPPGTEVLGFSLSPDGLKLVLNVQNREGASSLWLRQLDSVEMRELPGTNGAKFHPAWSPDSQSVAFLTDGGVKKAAISGGAPQMLAANPGAAGLSWGSRDIIVFGILTSGAFTLSRVSAAGGDVTAVTGVDPKIGELGNGLPFFLPDGKHFLYYPATQKPEKQAVYIGSVDLKPDAQAATRLLQSPAHAMYASAPGSRTGYLFFLRDEALMAQPFNPDSLQLEGKPMQITDHVARIGARSEFAVSNTGVLSYVRAQSSLRQLTWYNRQGKALEHVGEPAMRDELSLSPDGTHVAEGRSSGDGIRDWTVWQLDLTRGVSSRLTFEYSRANSAVWSPDGKQIVYAASGGRSEEIYLKAADGGAQGQVLFHPGGAPWPMDWSRDGRFLLYRQHGNDTGSDLWFVPMQGDHKPMPYLVTPFSEGQAQFSPDGHFVVYTSNETGTEEVYVRPFPRSNSGKWRISSKGGNEPRWRRDGNELFYFGPDNTLYSVSVARKGDTFQPGTPRPLFSAPITGGAGIGTDDLWRWDISNDGQRFLINTPAENDATMPVTVLLNWQSRFK